MGCVVRFAEPPPPAVPLPADGTALADADDGDAAAPPDIAYAGPLINIPTTARKTAVTSTRTRPTRRADPCTLFIPFADRRGPMTLPSGRPGGTAVAAPAAIRGNHAAYFVRSDMRP